MITSDKERISIQNITNGKVTYVNLKNNKEVLKGDTLLIINNLGIQHQLQRNTSQTKELNSFVKDISILLKGKAKRLQTAKYIQERAVYSQKINELNTKLKKLEDDYNRDTKLLNKGVIAKVTFNNTKLTYDLAKNAISQFVKTTKSRWQAELITHKNQIEELESNQTQLHQNKELAIVKAPYSGTLLNVQGIEKGSFITTGTQLATLSPKSEMIVECYVLPNDIGLLKKENKANFQISAFNYNQWGLATGKIIDIANDVQLINNTPMFRVLCSLDQNYLELKNGFKGQLKKGMTLNARFEITKRTLFDLFYDKADDWLNPTTQTTKN